ncbi:MAG: hypothetical protein IJ366_09020, partial [Clostridia bacterium]|nr:hypothetical protein [Clostridia bacterium]
MKGTILYIGGFELPDKNAAAHRVIANAKIFQRLGYNVVFVGVGREEISGVDVLETFETVQGFDSYRILYPTSSSDWIRYLTDISAVKTVCEKYGDVKMIVCYNYQAAAMARLLRYCRKNGIKLTADVTEWYGTEKQSLLFKIIKGSDTFFRMRVLQKKLDGLIVISDYLESYYKKS